MATNVFTKAKAYCKKHPRTSFQEAIQIVSGKKKKVAVSGVKRKKAAPAAKKAAVPRKIKVKIKPGKKGAASISISGIHLNKVKQELSHQGALDKMLNRHKGLLKEKGLTAGQKMGLRREIKQYQQAIKTSKQHVTALKRSI